MANYYDYEEEFYYDNDNKPKETDTRAAAAVGELLGDLLLLFFKFLVRIDLVSSALMALTGYVLTYKRAWPWYVYVIGAISIIGVSWLLQNIHIVFRIIYSVLACGAIATLVTIFKGYETAAEMYKIFAISFGISAIWALWSWKFVVSEKSK